MRSIQSILVLSREDLSESSENKTIEEINVNDFSGSIKDFLTEPFAIFVDRDTLKTKLIKNRYGDNGMVVK
jgi:hypothetical protein